MLLEDTPIGCSLTFIIVLGGVGFVNRFWRNLLHFGARFSEYRLKRFEAFTMVALSSRYGILQSWISRHFPVTKYYPNDWRNTEMPRKGENIYKRKDGRWEGRYIKSHKPDRSPQFGYVYAASYSEVKSKLIDLKAKVIFLLCFGRCMLFVLDTPHAKGNTSVNTSFTVLMNSSLFISSVFLLRTFVISKVC